MTVLTPELRAMLPTHLDLPCKDNKPVDNSYEPYQSALLTSSLRPWLDRLYPDGNYFIGADQGIYWLLTEDRISGAKAPDWFFVPGVPHLLNGDMRRSYVMWQEKVPPSIVVEYVSNNVGDERDDTPLEGKFWAYEQTIQAAYYAIWDLRRDTLEVHERVNGRYQKLMPNSRGRYAISPMKIELGTWTGTFQSYNETWLRAWDENGNLLPSAEEREETQRLRAEALAAKLRELGVDPSQL